MASVVSLVRLPRVARERLAAAGLRIYDGLSGECGRAEAVIVSPATPWERVLWALECSGARLLAVYGSGYDNLDLSRLGEMGVCAWNHPDYIAEAVAEHAVGLALALLRNIVRGDGYVRSGEWASQPPRELLGESLAGTAAGIVGMGRIGARLASLLTALGAERPIRYWSRRRKPELEQVLPLAYRGLDQLFEESRIVFVTLALTPETRRLIGYKQLSRMKKGFLVNVSRGQVVDTQALLRALDEGRLAGAALDVYEEEPLPKNHPLAQRRDVVLTPHIAGYTRRAMEKTGEWLAEELLRVLQGGKPSYPLTGNC